MKKQILILVGIIFILAHCGHVRKYLKEEITWTWDEDQQCATEGNIWGGFKYVNGGFKANKAASYIALWRKNPANQINLVYKSESKFPVMVLINGSPTTRLPFSKEFKRMTIRSPFLQKGINFIGFLRRNHKSLFIRNICFSSGKGENFVVEKGESVSIPFGPGTVRAKIKGRGRAEVSIYYGESLKKTQKRKISLPMMFFPKEITFSSEGPFLIRIKGLSGQLWIDSLNFVSKKKEENGNINFKFKKPYPDIYIFLIDACQASHLSLYGYKRKTSPNIDAFAKDSLVFDNAYTTASFTRASVASIFTGFFPDHHKVRIMRASLSPRLLTLPEFLKTKNYRTAIFTASANVSAAFGFSQGVDDFFGYYGKWYSKTHLRMPGDFIRWTRSHPSPKFAYLHFMEPHFPIIPPPPFKNMYKKHPPKIPVMKRMRSMKEFTQEEIQDVVDDYDSTITYIDSVLGGIWKRMKRMGIYDNSMIIFLSDHGEGLYEHGAFGHGRIVYEEMTHIPLVVKFPKYMNIKGRVETLVQVTDIFPTIAELFDSPIKFDGKSLLRAYLQKKQGDEFTVTRNFLNPGTYGLRWRKYYYILNMMGFKEEVFNLTENPKNSIGDSHTPLVIFLRGKFLGWLRKYQNLGFTEKRINLKKLSKKELENLRSLGYIK